MSDCNPPDVYKEKMVMARKSHTCIECRHPIFRGEKYQRINGLWEGRWATFATCGCCARTRCILAALLDFDECIPIGSLPEEIAEFERWNGRIGAIVSAPSEGMEPGPVIPVAEHPAGR